MEALSFADSCSAGASDLDVTLPSASCGAAGGRGGGGGGAALLSLRSWCEPASRAVRVGAASGAGAATGWCSGTAGWTTAAVLVEGVAAGCGCILRMATRTQAAAAVASESGGSQRRPAGTAGGWTGGTGTASCARKTMRRHSSQAARCVRQSCRSRSVRTPSMKALSRSASGCDKEWRCSLMLDSGLSVEGTENPM